MSAIKKIGLLLLLSVAIVGCRPRGVLSSKEMRDVLYDLHRADGAIQVAGYSYSHDQELAGYYKNVLDKHGITQADFDLSLKWYTNNPQRFNKIYPRVVARLEAEYDLEQRIRDANREKKLAERAAKKTTSALSLRQLPDIDDLQNIMLNGLENPWTNWMPKEFCEKNVIIFGQSEKN